MDVRGDNGEIDGAEWAVRAGVASVLAGPIVFAAVAMGWAWAGLAGWILAWLVAVPTALIAAVTGRAALRGFGAGNWVVRAGPEALEVRLRSFYNDDLPASDGIVVRLAWSELAFARRCTVDGTRLEPEAAGGEVRERRRYLELWTVAPLGPEVAEALARERGRRGHGRTHFHHHFVTLCGDRCLRVDFSGRHGLLRPGLVDTLAALGERVHVQQPIELTESAWSELSPEELDERILSLIERGERVRAIAAARAAYGFSIADAKRFVDELDQPELVGAA